MAALLGHKLTSSVGNDDASRPSNAQHQARPLGGRRLHAVVRRDGSERAKKMIVFGVRADPEPNDGIPFDDAQRSVPESHAGCVDWPGGMHELEAETSVLRILRETAVRFTSPALNVIR
jgi:hypothetical protein